MVKQVDFATLMASSVHDMKNIIAAVSQAYESLVAQMPPELQQCAEVRLIERESIRLDAMLVQLLGMYKFEHGQLQVQADYCRVDELFEDLHIRHAELLEYRQVSLQVELDDPDLEGFFDRNLISTVLDNALGNALNHCRETVGLHAGMEDGQLVLSVCDDGPGYPADMLGPVRQREASGIDRETGSTGLGLYFAASIVAMHDQPNREATLELRNSEHLGGACMQIGLPLPSLF
jgi:signal transduction histidine kinase